MVDGKFHSVTKLAQNLKISHTAISKQVNLLKQLGLRFSAVTGKGYCLENSLELLSHCSILAALKPAVAAQVSLLHIHDTLASTNDFLFAQASNNSVEICLAESQSSGKGRHGRQWISPFGSNIYLSIVWQYSQGLNAISGLSLGVGVAIIRTLKQVGFNQIGLKWPNDIFWQQQKLGGILVEVKGDAQGSCTVVVGIGINLALSFRDAVNINQPWVDLKSINKGITPPRNWLIATMINQLIPVMTNFEIAGISTLADEWRKFDCLRGRQIKLTIGTDKIIGTAQGIDSQGLLILRLPNGNLAHFASGEATVNQ